ncbi:hypothetical protein Hanom_Chr00s114258g01808831 [Helianthus anomalus]
MMMCEVHRRCSCGALRVIIESMMLVKFGSLLQFCNRSGVAKF